MSETFSADTTLPFVPPVPVPTADPPENFIFLRSLAALPAILKNPISTFSKRQFEELNSYTQLFHQPIALVHDPKTLRHLFVEHAKSLAAEPVRQAVLQPALRDGMLTAQGELWRRTRKTLAPVFSPRHVDGFAASMERTTKAFIDDIKSQGDGEYKVADMMSRLTYLILSDTLFSGELDADTDAILADVAHFLDKLGQPNPLDFLAAPAWMPRLTKLGGQRALKRFRSAVRTATERRKAAIAEGNDVPNDFLTLLLEAQSGEGGLSLDEVEDNIITFVAAGHETTARALAWTLYLLNFDPAAAKRCVEEIDGLDLENLPPQEWMDALPWTTACFEESMRLFPPAPMITRRLVEDFEFDGFHINAGANIMVSPWILHRHHKLWSEPDSFKPERFFGENRAKIDRFAYLPFGLGPRICIGARFAMQEGIIALALLLKNFNFTYTGKDKPWPVMKITLQPDNGVPMHLADRSHA